MAVYTEVDDEALIAFLARYDAGELMSAKGIAEGIENTNYLVTTSRANFILTLYERRTKAADLPFFIGLMQHLSRGGIACPVPIADRAGVALGSLLGRHAVLVSFLPGYSVLRPTPEHCAALGAALGALHLAGQSYAGRRENCLSVAGWHALAADVLPRAAELGDGYDSDIAGALERVAAAWPTGLPAGIIHADLFPDNVFFLAGALSGLIDFYFACNDMLAYDLAICLNAWAFETDGAFNITKAQALTRAYHAVRPLGPDELAALPILAQGAALRFLLTRAFDRLHPQTGALARPKDPAEYRRKLRFHAGVRDARAYGL